MGFPGKTFNWPNVTVPFTWQAGWIGARAKSLVNAPAFSGQVIAVLSDVAYLSGRDGEVLWLVREGMQRHGRGIPISFPPRSLRLGQNFLMEGNSLKIGGDLAIDLGRAAEWKPTALKPPEIVPLVRVRHFARQLLGAISQDIDPEGPGRLILLILSLLKNRQAAPLPIRSWLDRMLSPIVDLTKLCLNGGLAEIGIKGRELIGLGPGLTPCGDDFLGGLFFATHWLQEAYPGEFHAETKSILDLAHWARTRTNPISHAILDDLAIGQGPEPLHDLVRLLLKGADYDGGVREAINRLLRFGHTTGWHILAGVLTCLISVNEKANNSLAHRS